LNWAFTQQSGATWGLDRIDQPSASLSGTFTYTNTGPGVKAYIIDTGIRFDHSQLARGEQAIDHRGPCFGIGGKETLALWTPPEHSQSKRPSA